MVETILTALLWAKATSIAFAHLLYASVSCARETSGRSVDADDETRLKDRERLLRGVATSR